MINEDLYKPTHTVEVVEIPSTKVGKYNLPFILFPFVLLILFMINFGANNFMLAMEELSDIPRLTLLFFGGLVVHEFIHMLFWAFLGGHPFRFFRLGFRWDYFGPYLFSIEPLKAIPFKIGLLAPLVFMGFVPCGFAFYFGNLQLLLLGSIFTMWASGDIVQFILVWKVPSNYLINLHPVKFGCYIFRPTD